MNLEKLATRLGLLISLSLTICLTIAIHAIAYAYQLPLLDMLVEQNEIVTALQSMSDTQLSAHIVVTATLDVVYPLAFTALFIGSIIVGLPHQYKRYVYALLLIVPIDWLEGVVQIMMLTGSHDVMWLKLLLTPIKFMLVLLGILFSLYAWGRFGYRKWLVATIAASVNKKP